MEHPVKMDDLGVHPYFRKPPYQRNRSNRSFKIEEHVAKHQRIHQPCGNVDAGTSRKTWQSNHHLKINFPLKKTSMYYWLVVSTPLKNISQLG
jgi:hypothetical protein